MPYIFIAVCLVFMLVSLAVAYFLPALWWAPLTNLHDRVLKRIFITILVGLATGTGVLAISGLTTAAGWYAPHSGVSWLIVLIGFAFMAISLQARKEYAAKVAEGLSAEERILTAGHIASACSCLGWVITLFGATWLLQGVW